MKKISILLFSIIILYSVGCSTAGSGGSEVHWSTSISGGVYDSRDGDLGYVLMGSVTLYDKYPASNSLPIITQTKVKVTNVVSQDQSQNQGNGNSGGNGGGNGNGDSDDGDCKGKGHGKHHHHGHGNGHDCDPD